MRRRLSTVCLVVALIVVAGLLIVRVVRAAPPLQQDEMVTIYFFWGDGCPHCAEAKPFLEDLTRRYPSVQVEAFEVWYDEDGRELFSQMASAFGFEPRYVPTIFIGDQYWEGYSSLLRDEIERSVKACVDNGCPDAGAGIVPGHEAPQALTVDQSTTQTPDSAITVYLFWGDAGCNDCVAAQSHHATASGFTQFGSDSGAESLVFLRSLAEQHPNIKLGAYEVWVSSTNGSRFRDVADAYDVEARGVPTIFVGERVWEGFDDVTAAEIEAYLLNCLDASCPSPAMEEDTQPTPDASPTAAPTPTEPAPIAEPDPGTTAPLAVESTIISLPILGRTINLGAQSLWTSTALISFIDGFNPCSLWVLSILIALTLRTGSRKRIFTIGLIYITVTAGVYVLFIAGLFTFLTLISFMEWIQVAVSILALFFAAINIKDYFWYKEGISLTIADQKKPGIYKRMRKVMQAGNSFWALAGATVALGVGVSFVEFSCTAGFPVIWTNLVAAQGVTPVTFVLLLLLYMIIYQIDELAIFGVAVVTLKVSRLEEKHGRMLKLVGGTLMLVLAAVMLINPALMNELGTSLLIFGGAIVVALLVMVIHRKLLPKMGIHIGTELTPSSE